MKAHFSPMSWRFLLLMSCVHGLPSAAKSSFALFVLFFFFQRSVALILGMQAFM